MSAQNPFERFRKPRTAPSASPDGSTMVRVTQADIAAAKARQVEWDRMVAIVNGRSGDVDEAPEYDPALVAAVRAASTSGRFAHLGKPLVKGEAEARVSDVQAFLRQNGIADTGGVAGQVLAADAKRRTPTEGPPPPDINSTDPATARAAFILDAFRRGHEKQKR